MIGSLLVFATVATADPRVALTELQLQGRHAETLAAVEETAAAAPAEASRLGLDYLRGHLLDLLGREREANEAFAEVMGRSPALTPYARYRLALNSIAEGHPEVAAGLLAGVLSAGAPAALVESSVRLLAQTIADGGDCRLLSQLAAWPLDQNHSRPLRLAQADCALAEGRRDEAVSGLLELLRQGGQDDTARAAAERLDRVRASEDDPLTAILIGRAFHHNRLFSLSITYLQRGISLGATLTRSAESDPHYELARSFFWEGKYLLAASHFGRIAAARGSGEHKARALYQQGRCYELSGHWDAASQSYGMSYLEDPDGPWADAALLSTLRVEWRGGDEDAGLELYDSLSARRSWRRLAARGALFLASSDLVRGRADRAGRWLDSAAQADPATEPEVDYWRGRLAELEERPRSAAESYVAVLAADPMQPFAQAARVRLDHPAMADEIARLSATLASRGGEHDPSSLYHAWILLGDETERGRQARDLLSRLLTRSRRAREFLEMTPRPTPEWPLWRANLSQPEEQLLALGVWRDGASAVRRHFPVGDTTLALTGSGLLAQADEHRKSLLMAETLADRALLEVPDRLLPLEFRRLLYPLPFGELIRESAARFGVDPFLLAALIREESRFDPMAVSAASARGLTQFILPTAERLAPAIGRQRIRPEDLHDPKVSIALGAAYLAELAARFDNRSPLVVAAYNAGERQTELWRSYCFSRETEEFLSKVGFPETRKYLQRVLSSRAQYQDLYGRDDAARG